MKKCISVFLLFVVMLTACRTTKVEEEETFVPLIPEDTQEAVSTIMPTEPAGQLVEVPHRVYKIPWQTREVLEEGGYAFSDSTIPLFLFSQEEVDAAREMVEAYVRKEFMNDEGALRYTEIVGIAPDFVSASEYVSPENRKAEGIAYEAWAQENYYAHYMDFDVILYHENGADWAEGDFHVYNISLFRDDATDPTGWRVRLCSRPVLEPAYQDITAPLTMGGIAYFEPYRPLTFDELAKLEDMGGRVLFATEMLYQENTTWVYVYAEPSNEIIRREMSYSNIDAYIPSRPNLPK